MLPRVLGRHGPPRSQAGAAAVEFALVLPILLLVIFGIIDFGVVLAQKAALANAVRAGARYGSVNAYSSSHTCQKVIDKVRDNAQTIGIGTGNKLQVGVTVRHLAADGTLLPYGCVAGPTFPSSGATAPCVNSSADPNNPDSLEVDARFQSQLLVPVPGLGSSVWLSSSATYQCEYSQ